jgi:putative NADH-flavin reductase
MKLVIFGATGSVGIHLVKNALAQGHHVTAFSRSAGKLSTLKHENLNIFEGNLMDGDAVTLAITNQDAVLCAIGDGRAGKVRAVGTKHIIDGMKKANVKRLICQTTLGLGSSAGNLNFVWKYLMFGFFLKKAFKDHQVQEQYLFDCDRDYTIVRPSAFTDGEITKQYVIGFDGSYKNLNLKISRADVADFMVDQLTNNNGIKKAISISN